MKDTTRNALVGLFVLGGLGALAALMVMFGERPEWLGGAEWELRIVGVGQLRDLRAGDEITLNGVAIGRVGRLEFKDNQRPGLGVDIVALIKNNYSVPAASRALVYPPTLGIGRGTIEIVVDDPLSGAVLEKSGVPSIRGQMANRLNEIVSQEALSSFRRTVEQIGQFSEALTPVAKDMHELLQKRSISDVDGSLDEATRITANLATAIERFDTLMRHADAVVGDEATQENIKALALRLRESGEKISALLDDWRCESQQIADNVNQGVDHTEQRIDEFLSAATRVMVNLDVASDNLARASTKLHDGRGTTALLLNDPRLYESAVYSFDKLGALIATLQPFAEKIAEDQEIPVDAGLFKTHVDLKKKPAP